MLSLSRTHLSKDGCSGEADNKQGGHPGQKLLGKHPPVDSLLDAFQETHTHNTTSNALAGASGKTQPTGEAPRQRKKTQNGTVSGTVSRDQQEVDHSALSLAARKWLPQ